MRGLLFVLIISAMMGIAQSADFASYKIDHTVKLMVSNQTVQVDEQDDESVSKTETVTAVIIITRRVYYCGEVVFSSSVVTNVVTTIMSQYDSNGSEVFSYLSGEGESQNVGDEEPVSIPPWA